MKDEQLLKYSRHILLPQMDIDGQQALLDAHVLIVGAGGLGCPVIQYLAMAGVGRLTLIDDDVVELSNLQRQSAHGIKDIGLSKVASAKQEVARLNPDCIVEAVEQRADQTWLTQYLTADNNPAVDLVVDCTDNSRVRYAINSACLSAKTPWVSGAAVGLSGQITVFDPRSSEDSSIPPSPCYSCLYPDLADEQLTCSENGVLSPLVGVIGSMQALEAIKVLANIGTTLTAQLLTFDAANGQWRNWKLPRNPDCKVCGQQD